MYFQSKIILSQNKQLTTHEIAQLAKVDKPFNEIIVKKEDEENSIGIEQAKKISDWNSNKSNIVKLIIIKDAELLTTDAQNSLLKVIEEPNVNTQIVLVTNNLNKILQTIKSRCLIVSVKNQTEENKTEDLNIFLKMNFFDREKFLSENIFNKSDSRIEFGLFLENLIKNILNSELDSNTILCIINSIIDIVKKNNKNVNLKLLTNSLNFEIYYYLNK